MGESETCFAGSGLGIRDSGLDLIGRQIGVYNILSLLGAGGMGEVIARTIQSCSATLPSRHCPRRSPPIQIAGRDSNVKPACWPA